MPGSEYVINKGVNSEIEFKGLHGQWIYYLGGGLAALLIVFVILYLCGVNTFICLSIAGSAGLFIPVVYRSNRKFGSHGLTKKRAKQLLPHVIKNNSRKVFFIMMKTVWSWMILFRWLMWSMMRYYRSRAILLVFRAKLPEVFTISMEEYENIHQGTIRALKGFTS